MSERAISPSPSGRGWGEGPRPKIASDGDVLACARSLRKQQTNPESQLWGLLRNRRLLDLKFRRQHPHPPYVLDFYCEELRIAVELDGGQHNADSGQVRDRRRDAALARDGVEVIRYWNHDLLQRPTEVLEDLMARLQSRLGPSPDAGASTSPGGRGKRSAVDD